MRGERDVCLSWPFRGSIVITVLNQLANSEHYTKEIWSVSDNPGLEYTCRPHWVEDILLIILSWSVINQCGLMFWTTAST